MDTVLILEEPALFPLEVLLVLTAAGYRGILLLEDTTPIYLLSFGLGSPDTLVLRLLLLMELGLLLFNSYFAAASNLTKGLFSL